MPLFSPNPFSFSNILTDKVEVFWTRVYRQTGYSFMFISRPTFYRSTQYTSHILSLPSNKLTYSSRRQNGLQTTNIFTKTLVQTKDGCFVWSGDQHGRAMHSRNVGQLASPTVCMYPNSTRIALLTRERKRTHFPRGPTGLFILHFNNFTKTCQQLTNLSGEGLQRSSNLKTRLLYAIPTWIGKTAGEKLKN